MAPADALERARVVALLEYLQTSPVPEVVDAVFEAAADDDDDDDDDDDAQSLLLRILRHPLARRSPPAASYRARLLKAFVLRLEETGTEVSDALADAHAALLLGRGGDDGDEKDDGAWGWRTFAYRARGGSHRHPPPPPPPPLPDDDDDGDDGDALTRALADAEVRAVSIRASRNLFEGGTGCHAWRAGFHLAEMILRCVLSHTGPRTTASAW